MLRILEVTRKNTPNGDSLNKQTFKSNVNISEQKTRFLFAFLALTYQITHLVMIIIASLIDVKKTCSGLPCSRILPIVVPNTMLNMTMPNTLVVWTVLDEISHKWGG